MAKLGKESEVQTCAICLLGIVFFRSIFVGHMALQGVAAAPSRHVRTVLVPEPARENKVAIVVDDVGILPTSQLLLPYANHSKYTLGNSWFDLRPPP